ncbi:hypothetical protein FACS1894132_05190 [Clostridia bacterium]|nr:hypothetical protein FACS1894132_05190 [Clostridia bacterium]
MREELKPYEEKMKKSVINLEGEYGSVRAGKPNPAVLDKIKADYYGTPTAINAMSAIREIKPSKLILDFTAISFMDSSGIGLVAGRFKTMREFGGLVELIGVSKHIAKVMSLSGIDKMATVVKS